MRRQILSLRTFSFSFPGHYWKRVGGVCPEFSTKNLNYPKNSVDNRGINGCDKGRDNTVYNF